VITSYTAFTGRMKTLPDWLNKGAVVGMQGGNDAVLQVLSQIKLVTGSSDDVAGFWLQDWTGQRNFTSSDKDIGRVGLWWNWEVCHLCRVFVLILVSNIRTYVSGITDVLRQTIINIL